MPAARDRKHFSQQQRKIPPLPSPTSALFPPPTHSQKDTQGDERLRHIESQRAKACSCGGSSHEDDDFTLLPLLLSHLDVVFHGFLLRSFLFSLFLSRSQKDCANNWMSFDIVFRCKNKCTIEIAIIFERIRKTQIKIDDIPSLNLF
jgi:hypothetical protein